MPMRDDVKRSSYEHEYEAFMRSKIEIARAQMTSGLYRLDEEVEADFAARRAKLRRESNNSRARF
jgi:hypothetical protein